MRYLMHFTQELSIAMQREIVAALIAKGFIRETVLIVLHCREK
jgi:uncharacterized membrane protein